MCVSPCVCVLVAHSCLTLCDPRNCSPPVSSVHGILQARILEWVGILFSRESSQLSDQTSVSCFANNFFLPSEPAGEPVYKYNMVQFSLLFQDLTGFPFAYSKHVREHHGINICQLSNENYSPKTQGTKWGANNGFL